MFWKADQTISGDERIIIYGAGDRGIATFIMLLNAGIYVSAFCDADLQKQKIRIMNKGVISPEELYAYGEKERILVFIGSERYGEEIKENLRNAGFLNLYENRGEYQDKILCGRSYRYGRRSWYSIIEQARHKQIYVYGTSALELEFAEKLRLTDIEVTAFLVDDEGMENESGLPEIPVSELRNCEKDKIMVYVMSEVPGRVKVLEKLGLRHGYHYRMGGHVDGGRRLQNPFVRLDVNCGFGYVDDEEAPGYVVSGPEDGDCKIMILGASATDPLYNYFPTWVSFFQEELEGAGIRGLIYNGAQQAYSEQQCLVKLIRDLPVIMPDIVIHYGGGLEAMNLMQKERLFRKELPFAFHYVSGLFENMRPVQRGYVNRRLAKEVFDAEEKKAVCLGLPSRKTGDAAVLAAENYLYAVDCMCAVCKSRGVRFLNFLDPVPVYTERIGKLDREKLYHDDEFAQMKRFRESAFLFRKTVSEKADAEFHTDLTQVLCMDGMYHDVWHPNEMANRMLGRHVFERIMKMLGGD